MVDFETYKAFLSKIDCRFPYSDIDLCTRLINEACRIGVDAPFAVAYEIAYPGRSETVSVQRRLELLEELAGQFSHPLKEPVLDVVRAIIAQREVTLKHLLSLMDDISKFADQGKALQIVYMAFDDRDGILEEKYNSVIADWKAL